MFAFSLFLTISMMALIQTPKWVSAWVATLLILLCLPLIPYSLLQGPEYFFSMFQIDIVSFLLVLLTALIQLGMILVSMNYPSFKFLSVYTILFLLMVAMVFTFFSSSLFEFYIFFEASLFPIFSLILLWGYQPERAKASIMLLFYTSLASLPLLLVILSSSFSGFYLNLFFFKAQPMTSLTNIAQLFFLAAVLVKIPIFGPHQWLPKAHVEAPVEGSMVLAAILLKLGGLGLLRIFPVTSFNSSFWLFLLSLSLMGSSLISLICIYQFDMKILIAYSSVAHMSLVIVPLLLKSSWGLSASLAIMVAHGSTSSLLFAMSNLMYKMTSSRSILFSKGFLLFVPIFSLFWFLACTANMAGPFTFNLLGELVAVVSLMKMSTLMLIPFGIMMFMAAVYSLGLYSLTQHGKSQTNNLTQSGLFCSDFSMSSFHLYYTFSSNLAFLLFF